MSKTEGITYVSEPSWDNQRCRWRVRWSEGGKPRSRAIWEQDDHAAAAAFAAQLRGAALPDTQAAAAAPTRIDIVDRAWWSAQCVAYQARLDEAVDANNAVKVTMLGKAINALRSLIASWDSLQELTEVEAQIAELEAVVQQYRTAGKHGSRVDGVKAAAGKSAKRTFRPKDAVH